MSAHEFARVRAQALRIILAQLLATLVVAAVCGVAWGMLPALSAVIGGGIGVVAQASVTLVALNSPGASAAGSAGRIFLGWMTKVLITITLLVIAFGSQRLSPLPLLCGYAATILVYGIAAARVTKLPPVG